MRPFILAMGVFFASEAFFLLATDDLQSGLPLSFAFAMLFLLVGLCGQSRQKENLDLPEPRSYNVSRPKAFAVVKRVLKISSHGSSRWRINYEDKHTGEIEASLYFVDDSWRDQRWLVPSGRLDRTISAYLLLTPGPGQSTTVRIDWTVHSLLSRTECDSIIRTMTYLFDHALSSMQEADSHPKVKAG